MEKKSLMLIMFVNKRKANFSCVRYSLKGPWSPKPCYSLNGSKKHKSCQFLLSQLQRAEVRVTSILEETFMLSKGSCITMWCTVLHVYRSANHGWGETNGRYP